MTWGPQGTAYAAPIHTRTRKPAGWLYLFPVLWVMSGPVWLIALISASSTSMVCHNAGISYLTPECKALEDATVNSQMGTLTTALGWVFLGTCVVAALIGLLNRRAGIGFMGTRTGVIVLTALVATPHLAAYAVGYGLGGIGRGRRIKKTAAAGPQMPTESQFYVDALDTVKAITATVQGRTGALPGAVLGWNGQTLETARPRGGVLVLGPPGSGKTSAVIIPSVMLAPGACVASSIKADIMNATSTVRGRVGKLWHFDPGGDEPTPHGVTPVRWSPLVGVKTWDDALRVGMSMAEPLKNNAGNGADHFIGRATDWLQILLYAARLTSQPIGTVARWAMAAADQKAQTEVLEALDNAAVGGDAGAEIASAKYMGLLTTPDKERGSIISTLVGMLRVYDSVSARQIGEHPNFDPAEFVRSGDTLYLTASPDRQALYAPLIVALLEAIRFATYARHKRSEAGVERVYPHLTFALDEANTTAPIPLPNIISEAGGQGLHLVVGIQSIEPAVARWGPAARAFLTMFPTKAIFRGNFDRDTVQALSNAAGEYDRQQVSYSESVSYVGQHNMRITNTTPSYSTTRQKVLTEGDITSIPDGKVLVWSGPEWRLLNFGYHWADPVWKACALPIAPARPALDMKKVGGVLAELEQMPAGSTPAP